MTSLAHPTHSMEHLGVVRAERAASGVAGAVEHVAAALRARVQAWVAARRQAVADARFWELAQTDPRLMADISRAMSASALRDTRAYY